MLTTKELKRVLAGLPDDVLRPLYVALGARRALEATRVLAAHLSDGTRASEIVASLIRREVMK